jgi:5-methylcytosine-specific restriction endonuclease McrA
VLVLRVSLQQKQQTCATALAQPVPLRRPRAKGEAREKLTNSSFYTVCSICGSTHDLEMHHIISDRLRTLELNLGRVIISPLFNLKELIMRKQVPPMLRVKIILNSTIR